MAGAPPSGWIRARGSSTGALSAGAVGVPAADPWPLPLGGGGASRSCDLSIIPRSCSTSLSRIEGWDLRCGTCLRPGQEGSGETAEPMLVGADTLIRSQTEEHHRWVDRCGVITRQEGAEENPFIGDRLIISDNREDPGNPLVLDGEAIDAAAQDPLAIGKL